MVMFRTENDYAVTAMRLILGITFFAHGAQKALGWFGGPGFAETIGMLARWELVSRSPCSRSQLSS